MISFAKTALEGFTGTSLTSILPFLHSSVAMLRVLYILAAQRNLSILMLLGSSIILKAGFILFPEAYYLLLVTEVFPAYYILSLSVQRRQVHKILSSPIRSKFFLSGTLFLQATRSREHNLPVLLC